MSGTITFDRVPFKAATGAGLDFAATTHAPVRGATLEVVAATAGTLLASAQTSDTGTYSVTVPANTQVILRVKAELLKSGTPGWTVRVRDNTSGNALYVLDSAAFNTGTVATLTRDLNAPSGWNTGSGRYISTRSAAPFALLDTAYSSMQRVLTADSNLAFPELVFLWSPENVPVEGDIAIGEIETTQFNAPFGGLPATITVLGEADTDTDEFDSHVIAHEWGHYYQYEFSRDDSMGGDHDPLEQLDLRVAFSEGFADAFSAMATDDPMYRDSYDVGAATDFGADIEAGTVPDRGWYSEGAIAQLIYDLYDSPATDDDVLALGFGPVHAAMVSLKTTPAFVGIHQFLYRVIAGASAPDQTAILALATLNHIDAVPVVGAVDFPQNEANNGGLPIVTPIYRTIAAGQTRNRCSDGAPGRTYNKLGNVSLLRFIPTSTYTGTLTLNATSGPPADRDVDVVIYKDGVEVDRSEASGNESKALNLPAGTYVFEVFEASNVYADFVPGLVPLGQVCMNVTLSP